MTDAEANDEDDAVHIAIVDDEPDLRETIKEYLELQGFRVSSAADSEELRRIVAAEALDLAVLDINMPGEDGLSLARYLHEKTNIYIIMLTAADTVLDRIVGLEVGADDYLTKPVDLRELHARIKAILSRGRAAAKNRRSTTQTSGNITDNESVWFGDYCLHLPSQRLYDTGGGECPLTAMEFDLLKAFAEHPDRVLSRDQLLEFAHKRDRNRDREPFDRSIDLRISRIRRKIEPDPGNPQIIKTVRGAGYIFSPQRYK